MSFESLLIHTVTVFHRGTVDVDRYGNDVDTWDGGTPYPARVQQENSAETLLDRDTRVSVYTAFMPALAAVSALDEVEWQGVRLRVVGNPEVVNDGIGPHHMELVLEEVDG